LKPRRLAQAAVKKHERVCGMSKETGLNLELQSQQSWQHATFVGLEKEFRCISQSNPQLHTSATDN